jgi:hypothetical protein
MTIYSINTGTSANKGDGDSLRSAFHKINLNFNTLSGIANAVLAPPPALGDVTFTNATISSTVTNQNIVFDPNGIGRVRFRNTAIQFDNGSNGKGGDLNGQILATKGGGSFVGLAVDTVNSSLRIVGDKDQLGVLVDMGLYNGVSGAWSSKVLVDYHGNITGMGNLTVDGDIESLGVINAVGGVRFPDGSIQSAATTKMEVSYITSSTTVTGRITDVDTLRFDTESGFTLIDLGAGAVEVAMNSTFKYWDVDGQDSLIAEGLDRVRFVAGNNMIIETNTGTNPKSITFSVSGNASGIGNLLVNSTTLYANTSSRSVVLSNIDAPSGTSFISLPAATDVITPLVISSPNEIRLTTAATSPNPITIAPNVDGLGSGYVVIGAGGTTSTAGLFAFSAAAEIDFWPNSTIAQLVSGSNAGTLDLYTYDNNNISIRPNGTGKTIITSDLVVKQNVVFSTDPAGAGAAATNVTYQTLATRLDSTKQVHKLSSSDYYLPVGEEGQIAYFVPTTGASTAIRVWLDVRRSFSGTAVETTAVAWTPFSGSTPAYAIYTNSAWNTSF